MIRYQPCIVGARKARFTAMWEVTKRCNLECEYCCLGTRRNTGEDVSSKDMKKILDRIVQLGATYLYVTGGEPFIRDDLEDLLSYADGCFEAISVASNGSLITPKRVPPLARLRNLEYVCVGFDSLHNAEASWTERDRTKLLTLNRMTDAGIPCRVSATIGSSGVSWRKLDELLAQCRQLRRSGLYCRFIEPVPGVAVSTAPDEARKQAISAAVREWGRQRDTPIWIAGSIRSTCQVLDICPAGAALFFVASSGDVTPCSWLTKLSVRCLWGNLIKDEIDSIRNSIAGFRESIESESSAWPNRHCPALGFLELEGI